VAPKNASSSTIQAGRKTVDPTAGHKKAASEIPSSFKAKRPSANMVQVPRKTASRPTSAKKKNMDQQAMLVLMQQQ